MASPTILLFDPHPETGKDLASSLESEGFDVEVFASALAGQQRFLALHHHKTPPAAIICDYYLADGTTGPEIYRLVRHLDTSIPFIASHRRLKFWERFAAALPEEDKVLHIIFKRANSANENDWDEHKALNALRIPAAA